MKEEPKEPTTDAYGMHYGGRCYGLEYGRARTDYGRDWQAWAREQLTAARERIAELEGELSDIPRIVATVTDLERDLAAARADAARLREALEAIKRHVEISSPSMAPYSTVHHIATAALSSAATGGEGEG